MKVETVRDSDGNRLPITGRVRIEQRADLSFEGSGRIASIAVDVGDTVRRGQTLARLDPEPAQLKLQQARADVSAAKAQKAERELNFRQQQALFDDRVISPATLAAARAAYLSANEQLDSAKATEAMASRAVRTSAIVSPFNGRIVARSVQPFVDVTAGQSVLQIEGAEKAEVVGMLPAALVTKLKPGDVASAYTNANPTRIVSIRLESLSSRLENGALVQAIFRPVDANSELRSGEAVLIT
ncbi:efflux RND transporter periplasmic adaptor subunit, partial [Streptomyces sp. IBSBF 2953]|nr:efflux RND transporter periplasmic adaptor subunit [Streptomyces hayashii]